MAHLKSHIAQKRTLLHKLKKYRPKPEMWAFNAFLLTNFIAQGSKYRPNFRFGRWNRPSGHPATRYIRGGRLFWTLDSGRKSMTYGFWPFRCYSALCFLWELSWFFVFYVCGKKSFSGSLVFCCFVVGCTTISLISTHGGREKKKIDFSDFPSKSWTPNKKGILSLICGVCFKVPWLGCYQT